MKLYLKRDSSMEHTRFTVYDDCGDLRYAVTGMRSSNVDKMAVSNPESEVLLTLKVAPLHFLYAFTMRDSNHRISLVSANPGKACEFRFFGIDWILRRSADMRSFEVFDSSGRVVMNQNADAFYRTSSYTLDIFDESKELYCIAAAIFADVLNFADSAVAATT